MGISLQLGISAMFGGGVKPRSELSTECSVREIHFYNKVILISRSITDCQLSSSAHLIYISDPSNG